MNTVEVPGGGRIGLHRCPGANGHLRGDLHWLAASPAELMLTLITSEELLSMGLSDFFDQAHNAGLNCHHLPIRDMHAPDTGFQTKWNEFVGHARSRLANDELVLMHCRAGIGRAGTMAAALLVVAGMAPADAITRVRDTRPGALETRAQEQWVHALTADR